MKNEEKRKKRGRRLTWGKKEVNDKRGKQCVKLKGKKEKENGGRRKTKQEEEERREGKRQEEY